MPVKYRVRYAKINKKKTRKRSLILPITNDSNNWLNDKTYCLIISILLFDNFQTCDVPLIGPAVAITIFVVDLESFNVFVNKGPPKAN